MTNIEWKRLESSSRRIAPNGQPAAKLPKPIAPRAAIVSDLLSILAVVAVLVATGIVMLWIGGMGR